MPSFLNLSQPFAVISQTSLVSTNNYNGNLEQYFSRKAVAKFKSNQSYLKNEKALKMPNKNGTSKKKIQFNLAHCSIQSKTKQLTDVNNIEIKQLISYCFQLHKKVTNSTGQW